jgi:hypothetical protein
MDTFLNYIAVNYDNIARYTQTMMFKYHYKLMPDKDFLNEFIVFVYKNEKRIDFYDGLVKNDEIKKYLNYLFYKKIKSYQVFENNNKSKNYKMLELTNNYESEFFENLIYDDAENIYDAITIDTVLNFLKTIKNDDNYYKFEVWHNYYINKFSYQELTEKYKLSIWPIWQMVQDINNSIRKHFLIYHQI